MKLAVMQPYFLPYLGYFQAIAAVDKYILYDQLTYILNAWINKNRVRQRDCDPSYIIVPLQQKSSYELIANTKIDNSKPWAKKMLRTFYMDYCKADYYQEVMPMFESLLAQQYETISELNAATIRAICDFLDIHTIIESDNSRFAEMEKGLELVEQGDYSAFPYMELTKPIKKVARVIAMCKLEGVNEFVNAIGGTALYDKQEFAKYGINIQFIKMDEDIKYSQKCKDGSFEPSLSIVDVLMHNGKEGTKQLLNRYTFV